MAEVIFYLLDSEQQHAQPAPLALACRLAAHLYRRKQACLVLCEDKQQAEAMDELLWQLPANAFVPHNLSGEGPAKGTPVEIAWQSPARSSKPVLINLSGRLPEAHTRYKRIYDFVPADEGRKQQARDRYKQYRGAGHQLDTRPANSIEEN